MAENQKEYEALLAAAGLVKKEKPAELSPAEKVSKVKEYLVLLEAAKKAKDEAMGKKIRRILRKKYGFKISDHKVIKVEG